MKILVLNGSPAGKNSITLQTVRYLELSFPDSEFEVVHVAQQIRSIEKDFSGCEKALAAADLILFSYPVYTFLVPAQLHRFCELIRESGLDLSGKCAVQLTTSMHFYDVTAHRFIEDFCDDLGIRRIRGLSAGMEDLLEEKGQKEAVDFFRHVLFCVENRCFETPRHEAGSFAAAGSGLLFAGVAPEAEAAAAAGTSPAAGRPRRVAIVADLSNDADGRLAAMIARFRARIPMETEVVRIDEFAFSGGCLGCFHCASDGTCVYKDGFSDLLRERIQTTDATVYAYTVRDHSMGYKMKLFDDRQFCNGHRTVTMGKPVGYLVDGCLSREENLRTVMESRAQVGGNYLAGIASDERDPDGEIDRLARELTYAVEEDLQMPQNFYGVGGMKIFRDLIFQMRGLMREDHRFYRKNGFYDFPQKKKGRIFLMYLVGAMMKNKKMKGKMTEGMLLPYQKLMKKAEQSAAARGGSGKTAPGRAQEDARTRSEGESNT